MKIEGRFQRYLLGTILILLAILGIYIANKIYHYSVIIRGVLGFVVLYLQSFYIKHSEIGTSMDTVLSDGKVYEALIYAFVGPSIAYLAVWCIFDMFSFLFKNWLNF